MTKAEFREKHSEIIEYYQLLEMHLKGICASLLSGEDQTWFDQLDKHETDTLGALINKIQSLQKQKQLELFTAEDLETLNQIRKDRNYWVHQCFTDTKERLVIFKGDSIKHQEIAQRIKTNLNTVIAWNEKITKIERPLIRSVMLYAE